MLPTLQSIAESMYRHDGCSDTYLHQDGLSDARSVLSVLALAVLGRLEPSPSAPTASFSKKSDHRSAKFSLLPPEVSGPSDGMLDVLRNGDIGIRSDEFVDDAPGRANPVCSFCSVQSLA